MLLRYLFLLVSICAMLQTSIAQVPAADPATPPAQSGATLPELQGLSNPEMVATRKAAVQARLEALGQSNLPHDVLTATRSTLEQQLKLLTALEETFRSREAYQSQLRDLPQRVEALQAERKALDAQPPQRFPQVSESLRDRLETQVQTVQAEIENLAKQQATAELRLAGIARELEQLAADRVKLEKDLLALRGEVAKEGAQQLPLTPRVELLELQLRLNQARVVTLEAERQWLTRRGPLQDALLGVAKTRLKNLRQDLETVKQALGQVIRQEQAALSTTARGIERKLEQTADPVETMALEIGLATIEIRKGAAGYRQRLNRVSARVLGQEKFNSQEKQDLDRLAALVERYASGERVAQRLQVAFARLRHERARFRDDQVRALEDELDTLTEQVLELDERLYEFDRLAEARLNRLYAQLAALGWAQPKDRAAKVRQALDEQKVALREQQQALAALVQELNRLITLYRERKRLLDDRYRFILTRMFWFRDGDPMSLRVARDALAGMVHTAGRLRTFVGSELTGLVTTLVRSQRFWLLLTLLFIVLPWGAAWLQRWLRARVRALPGRDVTLGRTIVSAVLVLLRTSIWPTYIAAVLWIWPQIIPGASNQLELAEALRSGLRIATVLLWVGLLGHALFRRDGWGQRYLGFEPRLCRFLRRALMVGWLASLLLLVPRHILLAAPGEAAEMAENLALARLLFTSFQLILLALVGLAGRRGSCVMQAVLVGSRRSHGYLWRNWPLVYMGILIGIGVIIALDLQGYRYAARALWLRSAEALLVVLGLMAAYGLISTVIDHLARQHHWPADRPVDPAQPSRWSLLRQGRHFMRLLLVLIGFVAIQHLYGLDQDILEALDSVVLFAIGQSGAGQPLWLTLGDMIKVLLILIGSAVLIRNLPGLCEVLLFPRLQWDAGLRYAFLTLSRYMVILVGLWWSLRLLHLRWSSIQWILAAASVGVGFGLQEIVSNFVSGLILLVERPISVGDFVAVGDQEGTITRITIRATTIQNLDNQTVIIPNKAFIAGQVINWTLGDPYVRVIAHVGVAYGSDMELVKRLLTEVVTQHPKVLRYPSPQVLFRAFGDSSLDWEAWFFVPTPRERFTVANDVLLQVDQAFRAHGVQIPFPQRDLHLRSADTTLVLRGSGNGPGPESTTAPPSAAPSGPSSDPSDSSDRVNLADGTPGSRTAGQPSGRSPRQP